ncbi:6417_t:CDS:2 [Ambispora leptoticha]|uniref:6417_t:CDS:1 n=1 Tax=Ambispora leptoticha TaxID=144679 RepID=A0A9N8VWA8_9GLOM|nr:6417_t:CDS:2 [Ambispora leptoticha]
MTTSQDHTKPLLKDHLEVPSYNSVVSETSSQISLIRDLNTWDMIKLTICMAGLSKELIALVWLAGPLSGLIVQPVIGAYSDKSTFKYGRRRPLMILSGLIVCLSLFGIAYSNELAEFLLSRKSYYLDIDLEMKKTSIWIAVISFYCLDFSLNAVMAACRALIVDISPLSQQEIGNAWAGRMIHVGNIAGYFTGFINLLLWFPWLGDTQMKVLCSIAIFVLIASLIITCVSVTEKVYVPINGEENSTWIVDIYLKTHSRRDPNEIMTAVRYGSLCLLLYSIVSFFAGIVLPQLTPDSYPTRNPFTIYNIFTVSNLIVAVLAFLTFIVSTVNQAMVLMAVLGIPWAAAMWVPYALVGEFVSRNDQEILQDDDPTDTFISNKNSSTASFDKTPELEEQALPRPDEDSSITKGKLPRLAITPSSSSSNSKTYDGNNEEIASTSLTTASEFDAGMILGVHNIYIVLPQLTTALVSSVIFKIVKDMNGGDETGWVIRYGGIMMIAAAVLSRYIER